MATRDIGAIQKEIYEDSIRFFPDFAEDLVHHVLGLCGEAGEVANMLKKVQRGTDTFEDRDFANEFVNEIVDVFIYALSIAGAIGIDIGECYAEKREYNFNRFFTATEK